MGYHHYDHDPRWTYRKVRPFSWARTKENAQNIGAYFLIVCTIQKPLFYLPLIFGTIVIVKLIRSIK